MTTTSHCRCGKSGVEISGEPLLRFICHCTLCQAFNKAPVADVVLYRSKDVALTPGTDLQYQQMRKPPAVDRGTCKACGQPVAEFMHLPLISDIAFVPAELIPPDNLPEPAMRLFYDSRLEDVNDGLPRHEGYLASQFAVMRRLLPRLLF